MKLSQKAQATLRNLIICRQTQIDTRLASASGSGRAMLMAEQENLVALYDEIESLDHAPDEDKNEDEESAADPVVRKVRKKAGRPRKTTVEVEQ